MAPLGDRPPLLHAAFDGGDLDHLHRQGVSHHIMFGVAARAPYSGFGVMHILHQAALSTVVPVRAVRFPGIPTAIGQDLGIEALFGVSRRRIPISVRDLRCDRPVERDEIQRRTNIHQLIVDLPSDFPIVFADVLWIKQVFRNIVGNAVKYSPDGGVIMVNGERRSNDVIINIADQGIGISPEDLIPLFEKYFRVKSVDGLRIPGTGLGLPIARTIIEAHGGRIWAESKVGEGTILSFTLPYSQHLSVDIH